MKKIVFMLFSLGLIVTLAACKKKPTDDVKPVLNGLYPATVIVGDTFNPMATVTATDDVDGDVSANVVVTGTVDTDTVGTYTITYTVKDAAGNENSKGRSIIVKEKFTFVGVTDKKLKVNDAFDPLEGIKVLDNHDDSEVSLTINVDGTADVTTAGEYTLTYSVTDATGYTQTATRKVIVSNEIIGNPDFSKSTTDLAPWGSWAGDGGSGTASVKNGEAEVVVTAIGTNNYHVQFEQTKLVLEKGKSYRITFKARSLEPRTIGVVVEDPSNNYHKYAVGDGVVDGQKILSLTTTMETYTLDIFINTNTISTGKLGFMLGKVGTNPIPTTVYFDDFTMEEVTAAADETAPEIKGAGNVTVELNATFDPLAGVTVQDNQDVDLTTADIVIDGTVNTAQTGDYTLTYTLTDASGNTTTVTRVVSVVSLVFVDTNEVVNGDFSTADVVEHNSTEGATGWIEWHQDWDTHGAVTYSINQDGQLEANITALGSNNAGWTIQLQQYGINLEKGKTYKLVFDAKSSVNRDINGLFKTRQDSVYTNKQVSLTDTMQTFEHMFTVTQDSNSDMTIGFEMGAFGGTTPQQAIVTLDNIKLLVLDEPTLLTNGNFNDFGFEAWYGNADWAGFANANYAIVDNAMVIDIVSTGNQPWGVQLNQLGLTFENGKTYKIVLDVKADEARRIDVKAGDSTVDGGWHALVVNATTDYVTYELEFTYGGETKSDARFNIEMGYFADIDNNGTPDDASDDTVITEYSKNTKVYVDNVQLLVKGEDDQFTDTNQVKNGSFDQALNWTRNQANADAPVSAVDTKAQMVVTEIGANNWSNQLFQQGLTLKGGRTYVVEFKASALAARPMEVKIEDPNNGYHTYKSEIVELTTEEKTYTVTFTVDTDTITTGKLGFHLGPVSGTDVLTTVTFDDIMLYPTFNPAPAPAAE